MDQDDVKDRRSVFVVFGRNSAINEAMFDFLRSIDLRPTEWDEAVALTRQGSPYVGQILDTAFANAQAIVVLLTPDEVAYLQPQFGDGDDDPQTLPSAQARPNVLFEAGMALGRNAERTVLVEVGETRSFSDVAGRHVVRLTNAVASRQSLATRLSTAGCAVRLTGTDWHTTGDFTPPAAPGGGRPLGRRVPSAAGPRPPVDFDAKYHDQGSNRMGKLQVINRGTDVARNVRLAVEEGTALDLSRVQPIERIPGGGKSVTVNVFARNRHFGANEKEAFDLTITAETDSGDPITQTVFMDVNA